MRNKIAYISICSDEYLKYYDVLYNSLKKYAPDDGQILFYIGDKNTLNDYDQYIMINDWYDECDPSYTRLERICSLRARAVLETFEEGYDIVVFLGAKVEFFSNPYKLVDPLKAIQDPYNAVVTPHILEPLPEDGKFPSNASVSFTGHISTDVVSFRNCPEIIKFLTWQDEIMKTKVKTTSQTYLDQSWLNFLPFFVDNVKILRDPTYNVAYWNFIQRRLQKWQENWYTSKRTAFEHTDYGLKETFELNRMVCFQYSGLDLNNPEGISTHQNRYKAEGEFLEFLKAYAEKVK